MFMFQGNTIAQLTKTRPQDKARSKGLKEALPDDRPVVQDLRLHSSCLRAILLKEALLDARPKGLKEALLDDRPVVQDLRLHSS